MCDYKWIRFVWQHACYNINIIIDADIASSRIHDRVAGLAGTQFLRRHESVFFFMLVQRKKPIKSNWQ